MSLYKVQLSDNSRSLVFNGVDTVYVEANSDAEALAIVKAESGVDLDVVWNNATVTAVSGASLQDLKMTLTTDVPGALSFSVTGAAGDTIDTIGAAMTALLNADANFANVTYDAGTNVMTIGAGDNQGLANIAVSFSKYGVALAGYTATVSAAGGVAATARTVTLPSVAVPGIVEKNARQ